MCVATSTPVVDAGGSADVSAQSTCAPCVKDTDCPAKQGCSKSRGGKELPVESWACKTLEDIKAAQSGVPVCAGDATDSGAAKTDGGTAGPTCLPSPYTPTAAEKAAYGAGCSAPADAAYAAALSKDPKAAGAAANSVKDCMIGSGACTSKGDAKTAEGQGKILACTAACVRKASGDKVSAGCATCYAVNGICGFMECLDKCAVDASSKACGDCLACNCNAKMAACMQLP